MDKSTLEVSTITGPMHAPLRHDSAHKHVAGTADYIDDMPEPAGTLHGALGLTNRAHAEILEMDLAAVAAVPGVVCVLTARDMPHSNDISPTH
ncbi:xanthine dehydrogenase molybdopterin binding subunit, partial [Sinorhizobium meliloti]